MNEFGKYLHEKQVFYRLLEEYQIQGPELKTIDKILKKIVLVNDAELKPSLIGNIYQEIINSNDRKCLGEFYTPEDIVSYIMNAVGYIPGNDLESKYLIDFGCGAGSFLIEAAKILILHWRKEFKVRNDLELTCDQAKKIIKNIHEVIEGIEINPVAVILCQLSLHLILFYLYKIIIKLEEDYSLPLFKISNISIFEKNLSKQYDFVVGNPPYLFIRDIPLKQKLALENLKFKTLKGQYDYYQIFIEIGIRKLREGGYLGYIVPDSILTLSNKRITRQYILSQTRVKEIHHVGPKFNDINVSNTIIVLQKELTEIVRKNNIVLIGLEIKDNTIRRKLCQGQMKEWNYDFLIHLSDDDSQILYYLKNNFLKLKDLIDSRDYDISLNRGVELGKEGEVIFCENCGSFIPLPKKITSCKKCGNKQLNPKNREKIILEQVPEHKSEEFRPYIYSLNQYAIKEKKYINTTKNGINYKSQEIYLNSIVIRQISQNKRICATFNKGSWYTSQSIYNLRIIRSPNPEFNIYYLLGLINSMLMSYFFMKSFGSYKKMFPRILIEKIKEFPIKIPETAQEKEIAIKIHQNVIQVLKPRRNITQDVLIDEIDGLVLELYKLPISFKKVIQNSFS